MTNKLALRHRIVRRHLLVAVVSRILLAKLGVGWAAPTLGSRCYRTARSSLRR